jgi:hypothetical protein
MDSDREAAEGTQQLGLAPPFARGLTGLSGVTTRPAGYPQWWGTTSDREAAPLTMGMGRRGSHRGRVHPDGEPAPGS